MSLERPPEGGAPLFVESALLTLGGGAAVLAGWTHGEISGLLVAAAVTPLLIFAWFDKRDELGNRDRVMSLVAWDLFALMVLLL
ncbi:hypothetical protein FKR81_26705 [Lentzea tibetensis]|uniref:Uncharacterized protein n=1 Tax=Lentzea tibetensis TaxID=2591470 RepID=A0A563ENP2_9PSEU|nr:hypothetical protein [Lentzea tibetensis]TWP48886.1 hypothetical protein FKR81_26705 [Lentzea tibetensis]